MLPVNTEQQSVWGCTTVPGPEYTCALASRPGAQAQSWSWEVSPTSKWHGLRKGKEYYQSKSRWYCKKEEEGKYNRCSSSWSIQREVRQELEMGGKTTVKVKMREVSCAHWLGSSLKLVLVCGECEAAAGATVVHLLSLSFLFLKLCVMISL